MDEDYDRKNSNHSQEQIAITRSYPGASKTMDVNNINEMEKDGSAEVIPDEQGHNVGGVGGGVGGGVITSKHHKRQSTRLLLDSLQPTTVTTAELFDDNDNDDTMMGGLMDDNTNNDVDTSVVRGPGDIRNQGGVYTKSRKMSKPVKRYITWGMILVECDNFREILTMLKLTKAELIKAIQNIIDGTLKIQDQYVDHMTEGQFVILTPVDIVINDEIIKNNETNILNEKKEQRLFDIANEILSELMREDGLSFCIGVALQDNVYTDQEWFEKARDNMQEMKTQTLFQSSKYNNNNINNNNNNEQNNMQNNNINNIRVYDENMEQRLRRHSQQRVMFAAVCMCMSTLCPRVCVCVCVCLQQLVCKKHVPKKK